MNDKLILRETVIVEGRYDKIKLSELIASPVIETGGFRVFQDQEKQTLIRKIAERNGILIMTDVDSAGFVIRNFIKGIAPPDRIKHAYIPIVKGKERRKSEPSKEGTLGVEGLSKEALITSIRKSGAEIIGEEQAMNLEMTKADFYAYGLSGRSDAALYRERILLSLGLPRYLSADAMISAVNCLFTKSEFEEYLKEAEKAFASS